MQHASNLYTVERVPRCEITGLCRRVDVYVRCGRLREYGPIMGHLRYISYGCKRFVRTALPERPSSVTHWRVRERATSGHAAAH